VNTTRWFSWGAVAPLLALFAVAPADIQVKDSASGKVLASHGGMTLYTFAGDKTGQSNCTGDCAKNWPPALAGKNAKAEGDFTLVKRADGHMQWAYRGMPLYQFKDDRSAGDMKGEGMMNGQWHLAKQQG
jgi:predicted lipoprotein with Yx(FWY)xxD motif